MELSSLPARPLALAELQDLEHTGRFRAVVPAAVFDLDEHERRLVPAVVFVADARLVAAGYDLAPGAWTRVETREAPGDDDAAEEAAREAIDALREWADGEQAWATPGEAEVLLDELSG